MVQSTRRRPKDPDESNLVAYATRVLALSDDPHITADLFTIGAHMARRAILGDGLFRTWADYAQLLYGDRRRVWAVKQVFAGDIRRYDRLHDDFPSQGPCEAPMVRRAVCGKEYFTSAWFQDPGSGRFRRRFSCRDRRHVEWLNSAVFENRAALRGADLPRPAANVGGVLARYLPEFRWAEIYHCVDPSWVAPPELEVPRCRPTLTIHQGGGSPRRTPRRRPANWKVLQGGDEDPPASFLTLPEGLGSG